MADSLPDRAVNRHPVLPDIHPQMVKAHVRIPDMDWMRAIGEAIQDAVKDAKLSNKEAAALACVDDAEFGKWLNASRRPQLDKVFAVEALRRFLVVRLAALAGHGVEIETVVRIRRSA